MKLITLAITCAALLFSTGRMSAADNLTVRFGHFPNVTHAQGLIAHAFSRQGKGWFEQRLGPGVKVEWYTYNAGPSAMEALFAGSLDVTYVGTGPALTAHLKAKGTEIRVISGAANGGAALVTKNDSIKKPEDFRGKRVATPQMGNTQDIACRAWLKEHGFRITQTGGDVLVVPTSNPDQLAALVSGNVDAVWTVEPWVTRLEKEASGKVFLEDDKSITTWLVSSVKFLKEHPDLAKKIASANKELTQWINSHPAEAGKMIVDELKAETKTAVSPDTVNRSLKRIKLTTDVSAALVQKAVQEGQSTGFLKGSTDTSRLLELQ
jgi:NitT/TauT family transport system substrate-binding protein